MNKKLEYPTIGGPETKPLGRYIENLEVAVIVYDKKDNIVRENKIDYGDASHRKWLGSLSFWAYDNGHSIETMKLSDYEKTR